MDLLFIARRVFRSGHRDDMQDGFIAITMCFRKFRLEFNGFVGLDPRRPHARPIVNGNGIRQIIRLENDLPFLCLRHKPIISRPRHNDMAAKIFRPHGKFDPPLRHNFLSAEFKGAFIFLNEIEVYQDTAEATNELPSAKVALTWDKTLKLNDKINDKTGEVELDGSGQPIKEAEYGTALGYEFDIQSVNGKIGGEDGTVITGEEAFGKCNPDWAIVVVLKKVDDKFEVVKVVPTPGSAAGANVEWTDDTVVMVIHSASSVYEDAKYTNWQGKVVALALQPGDIISFSGIDLTEGTASDAKATVESVANPVYGSGKEVIVETITVDGDLNDTGWDPEKWVQVVPGTNGGWQGSEPEGDKIGFSYQIRTDDNNLYVAVKTNFALTKAPAGSVGNGNSTNLRVWLKTDSDQTVYTHFFDSYIKDDGTQGTRAAVNHPTPEKANNPTDNDESGYKTVMTADNDGNAVAEMSIPLDEVGAGESFLMYVTVSNKAENSANQCLFAPALGNIEGVQKHIASAWSEADGNVGLEITVADLALGEREEGGDEPEPQGPTYEDLVKEAMGQASEDAKFALELSADKEEYKAGDKITVTVKAKDITVTDGLTVVRFNLTYDNEKLEFVVDKEKDFDKYDALLLKAKAPGEDSWESLSSIKDNGVIEISYGTSDPDAAAKADGDLEFTFEFTVKADAKGDVGVWVPHESVVGYDSDVSRVKGNGDYVVVAEAPIDNPDNPKPPKPGDVSVSLVVLAIVALVAVAGSAVVIKTRR